MGADIPQGQGWPACKVTKWQIQGEAVPLGECSNWQRLLAATSHCLVSSAGTVRAAVQLVHSDAAVSVYGHDDHARVVLTCRTHGALSLLMTASPWTCLVSSSSALQRSAVTLQQQLQKQQQDQSSSDRWSVQKQPVWPASRRACTAALLGTAAAGAACLITAAWRQPCSIHSFCQCMAIAIAG